MGNGTSGSGFGDPRKLGYGQIIGMSLVLCFLHIINGCVAGSPSARNVLRSDKFLILTARDGDSLESLADEYLGGKQQSWIIAEYNDLVAVEPGREIIIPLKYNRRGGLFPNGYQVVPILVYHRFGRKPKDPLCVSADDFNRQMRFLKNKGYRTIPLKDFYQFLQFKKTIPRKAVIITIDDGYRSIYDIAYPILRRYGFTASIFIYTDFVENGSKAMTWAQLRELKQAGFEIESHTKSHADLTVQLPTETKKQYHSRLKKELNSPRTLIRQKLGHEVLFLAYPYGKLNDEVIAQVKNAGYRAAFTVSGEPNPFFVRPYAVSRIQVSHPWKMDFFSNRVRAFHKQDLP